MQSSIYVDGASKKQVLFEGLFQIEIRRVGKQANKIGMPYFTLPPLQLPLPAAGSVSCLLELFAVVSLRCQNFFEGNY